MSNLKQQDLPAEDLSDLGEPARGAGLSGLLSPNADEQAPTTETPNRPDAHPVQSEQAGVAATLPAHPPNRARRPGRPRTRSKPVQRSTSAPASKAASRPTGTSGKPRTCRSCSKRSAASTMS